MVFLPEQELTVLRAGQGIVSHDSTRGVEQAWLEELAALCSTLFANVYLSIPGW